MSAGGGNPGRQGQSQQGLYHPNVGQGQPALYNPNAPVAAAVDRTSSSPGLSLPAAAAAAAPSAPSSAHAVPEDTRGKKNDRLFQVKKEQEESAEGAEDFPALQVRSTVPSASLESFSFK